MHFSLSLLCRGDRQAMVADLKTIRSGETENGDVDIDATILQSCFYLLVDICKACFSYFVCLCVCPLIISESMDRFS